MVVISAGLHLAALGVAVVRPAPGALPAPASVISVELVADPTARPAAPKPKPQVAAVRPPAPKPPPKPAKTVLPAKPTQPKPRAKPEPAPERKEVVIDPAPKEEKSLEDLLADFREEQGETAPPAPTPGATTTAAVPAAGAAGGTARVSPEVADWMRRAKIHVKQAWVVPPGFRNEPLQTHVVVKLDGQGNVVGAPEITRRSGNPWYDEGVVRGIQKASPLPPPPEPGDWDFVFVPEDAY